MNIFHARVAEQAECFDDMFTAVTKILEIKGANLTLEERNLVSSACKNLIS